MRRRRTLITPPLKWQMAALPVAPPALPVIAERGGTQLRTPKPTIVIDTREQNPFSFERFHNWFSGIERRALELGDYSIAGLEEKCAVERKDLGDLVRSFQMERPVFVARLKRMSAYPDRLLLITAPLSQVKSRYEHSHAISHRHARRASRAVTLRRHARTRRRNCRLLPLPDPSLSLARVERPRPPPRR
jgi:hypothetical protein